MNVKKTDFAVYIIESVKSEDFAEGEYLNAILNHSITCYHKDCISVDHLKDLLKDFRKSKFRYLHLSCHANESGIFINGDFVSNRQLQEMLGKINDRRVFLSACEAGNENLAHRLISLSRALSVIGTPLPLNQDKAAVFWPAFYYVMKEGDLKKMTMDRLKTNLQKCVDLFDVPINYYSAIIKDPAYLRRAIIRAGKKMDSQKIGIFNKY
jgi:hypothetical protein